MKTKPKILVDIRRAGIDPFRRRENGLINLSFEGAKTARFSAKKFFSPAIIVLALYIGALAVNPTINSDTLAQSPLADEQAALQQQLQQYEAEITELNTKIATSQKHGISLKSDIDLLNHKIAAINLKIKAVNLAINKLKHEISGTVSQINQTQAGIDSHKSVLTSALQKLYISGNAGTLEILLKSKQLSEFFNNINSLDAFQGDVRAALESLSAEYDQLSQEKDQLDKQKAENESIKRFQASQQAQIQQIQDQKKVLLTLTKAQESQYKDMVAQKQIEAAKIRSRIFRLLGGGELEFGDAVKIAQVAEKATGVRAAFILSILTQESSASAGTIGGNLGRCYYNTPASNASGTVMSNKQKPAFLALISSLGGTYKAETTPVSCPIVSDGAYGGAMGPAQFLPTTWQLYGARVAHITGADTANPFNNLDAFTATALYLQDALGGCKTIYSSVFSQENCAAAKYYSGAAWRNYTYPGRYGYRVADRAQQFQNDIDTLNSAN